MHFNLKILNLLIGLCDENANLHSVFWQNGYCVEAIEPQIHISDGVTSVPEMMLASTACRNTILVESKSGHNTELDQLARYRKVTPKLLSSRFSELKESAESVDVALIGKHVDLDRLRVGPQKLNWLLPLLTYDEVSGLFALREGTLAATALNESLREGISIPANRLPLSYVPYDWESDSIDVAEQVLPVILSLFLKKRPRFNISELCQESHCFWHHFDGNAKKQLVAKVSTVVSNLATEEFQDIFAAKGKAQSPLYQFSGNYRGASKKLTVLTRQFKKKMEAAHIRLAQPAELDPQSWLFPQMKR